MALLSETVIDIKHWTNKTFSFKTTKIRHSDLKMVNLQ